MRYEAGGDGYLTVQLRSNPLGCVRSTFLSKATILSGLPEDFLSLSHSMDHDGLGLLHIAACCVLIPGILAFFWRDPSRRRSCLPPGPPGELLLGHLRVIPKSGTAIAYANWSREYS